MTPHLHLLLLTVASWVNQLVAFAVSKRSGACGTTIIARPDDSPVFALGRVFGGHKHTVQARNTDTESASGDGRWRSRHPHVTQTQPKPGCQVWRSALRIDRRVRRVLRALAASPASYILRMPSSELYRLAAQSTALASSIATASCRFPWTRFFVWRHRQMVRSLARKTP